MCSLPLALMSSSVSVAKKSLYFPEFYNILGFATISDTKFNYSISETLRVCHSKLKTGDILRKSLGGIACPEKSI